MYTYIKNNIDDILYTKYNLWKLDLFWKSFPKGYYQYSRFYTTLIIY